MTESTPQTIMVVDDTPANLKLLDTTLTKQGYRVLTMPRGELALKAARRNRPDLILLDINMPGLNGFEVCQELKKDDDLRDIPVLFISAYTEVDDKMKAFSVGGVDYVSKPFQEEEVLARVRTHLELSRQKLELEQKNEELIQLNGLRENLTHMIIHDLRTPLTAINGSLEVLEMLFQESLPEKATKLVDNARRAGEKMIEMVGSVLDLDRLETGNMPVQLGKVDLMSLIKEVLGIFEDSRKGISFDFVPRTESIPWTCDRELIRRVLVNLVSNAVKFSPMEGVVKLDVQKERDRLILSVQDEGDGMPLEVQQLIFEKYQQVQQRKFKHSSGIGLAFCKLAVQAHGGEIWIESTPGEGSTFYFTIPILDDGLPSEADA